MKNRRILFTTATLVLLLSMVFLFDRGYAVTSYDVTNEVQMYLDTTISTTTATGIVLASPKRNGVNHTFATTTGGVLRLRIGSKVEDIYYGLAEVRSDNTVNLQGVTRNLCTGITREYVSCGNGKQFSRGAIVELNVDARIINNKINADRPTTFTKSGSTVCNSTSQPCYFYNSVTTAQRDAFSYEATNSYLIPNSTKGTWQWTLDGTSFYDFGSGSNINASETEAGKVEFGTGSELINRTRAGGSSARLALSTLSLTQTGGVVNTQTRIGYIPMTNSSGYIDVRIGGTGTGASFGSGDVLIAQGTGAFHSQPYIMPAQGGTGSGDLNINGVLLGNSTSPLQGVAPGSDGNVLSSDGSTWISDTPNGQMIVSTIAQGTNMDGASYSTGGTLSISGSSLAIGDTFRITAITSSNGGTRDMRVSVGGSNGGVVIAETTGFNSGRAKIDCVLTIRTIGASGTMFAGCDFRGATSIETDLASSDITIDTTVDDIEFTIQGKQTAGSETDHYVEQFILEKSTPLATE